MGFDRGPRRVSFRRVQWEMSKLSDQSFPVNFPALGQPIDELALVEIKGAILAKQCGAMAYAGTSYAQAADATLIEIF